MTRQLYELKHPLYPHPDLLAWYAQNKMKYVPYPGSYDDHYNQWYQLVRADHDQSGAPKRDIYREVQQIIRIKSASKEYIMIAEHLIGEDHQHNPVDFFHTYGTYQRPGFRTMYNYDTKQASTIFSGQVQTVYFIPFNVQYLENLYKAGPDDLDIGLYVYAGEVQYGGRGFYTYDEFKNLKLEELAEIGRTGKGMFSQKYTSVPTDELAKEYHSLGVKPSTTTTVDNIPPQTWHEFLEFRKWKEQSQRQQVQQQPNHQTSQKGK